MLFHDTYEQDLLWHNTQYYYLNIMIGGAYDTVHTWHTMLYILYVIDQHGLRFRRLALRLEALSTQVQRMSKERDATQLTRDDLHLLLQRYSTTFMVLIMQTELMEYLDLSIVKVHIQYSFYCMCLYRVVTRRILFCFPALDRTSKA